MSRSSEGPPGEMPAGELPKLAIACAEDLFTSLRSEASGVRLSVLSAISRAPGKALSYGPYNGRDLLEEMLAQLAAARDNVYRRALLGAIAVFNDPRVKEAFEETFRTSRDAREAAICAARLSTSPDPETRSFFLRFLGESAQPRARLSANVLARFDDHSPDDKVRIAVLCDEPFPTPQMDDETEAVWLTALRGPTSFRARSLLESLGRPAFVRLRKKWNEFTPELNGWLLEWGGRAHQAHAVELCLKALDEGPDDLRQAALKSIAGLGPASNIFSKIVAGFINHPSLDIRLAALRAGAEVPDVRGMLREESDIGVRLLLIPRLAPSYGAAAVPDLAKLMQDESWQIRNAATVALISLGEAAAEAAENLAGHESVSVRAAAFQVLEGISKPALYTVAVPHE